MNYSADNDSVRVDFFKDTGKWYATEAVKFGPYEGAHLIYDCLEASLAVALWDAEHCQFRFDSMWAVCLEPYHEHAHPLMLKVDGAKLVRFLSSDDAERWKVAKRAQARKELGWLP